MSNTKVSKLEVLKGNKMAADIFITTKPHIKKTSCLHSSIYQTILIKFKILVHNGLCNS